MVFLGFVLSVVVLDSFVDVVEIVGIVEIDTSLGSLVVVVLAVVVVLSIALLSDTVYSSLYADRL